MTFHSPFARGANYLLARSMLARRALRRTRRRKVAILMYHGVADQPSPLYNWCHMPVGEFSEQMSFLSETYHPLPLSEVIERLASGRSLPDLTVCVTFDDGFRNNKTHALPVLRKHGIPCTIFVSTSLPDTGRPPWPEEVFSACIHTSQPSLAFRGNTFLLASAADRLSTYHALIQVFKQLPPAEREAEQFSVLHALSGGGTDPAFATMTWPEIDEIARDNLVQIGSHTHTHEILTLCTPERQREELTRSRDILRERLGYCDMLAYPNGDYTQGIQRMTRELGYRAAVTARHRLVSPGGNLFALDRIGIGAGWLLNKFEVMMLGY